ncbi:MAG TPA: GWxTD domain-containing protein [Candidatus Acidoferrales bacterium]|nr:GWxTD domain-containing protein [Candidatus Acidoferrales bacterium]
MSSVISPKPVLIGLVLVLLFGVPDGIAARPQSEGSPQGQEPSAQLKQKSDRRLLKELETPYRKWLEEDVVYIITPEERRAFLQLSTNEEREQFIENFWRRRNTDPESAENNFKEEHYRRIAYADEHFASGIPGWKTDRGRTYIIWGPPDSIESHPSGGTYDRPSEQGGGETSTYPFEIWNYRYLEGIGQNVDLEFVDTTMTGEYHLTMDPCEKDALAKVPNAGLTMAETLGQSTKAGRFTNTDGTTCGPAMGGRPASWNEFDRISQFAKIGAPPPLKFKDLEPLVTSRVLRNQIKFEYRTDYMRVTSDTVLVPITIQIPNRQLTFQSKEGVHSAVLEVFGRVTTITGRVMQTFEDTVNRDFPESLLRQSLQGASLYQKAVPLRPGLYRLDLVVKDMNSGNVGTWYTSLRVPHYDEDKLTSSTMILADQIERVSSKQIGLGQFVIGDTKVRPRMDQSFSPGEQLGLYLQVYNLIVDEKTHKSDVDLNYLVTRIDGTVPKEVVRKSETSAELGQTGQQITLRKLVSLEPFEPGRYKVTVQIYDKISKQSISSAAEFTVKAPVATAKN